MDSLKRAEEIAKFLRQQTDFWMDQVRQIEQAHNHQPATFGAAPFDPSSFLSSVAGIPQVAGNAGASAVAAVAASSNAAAATQPSSETQVSTSNTTAGGSNGAAKDPMAELRRVQKEQWERKRTSSSVGLEAS